MVAAQDCYDNLDDVFDDISDDTKLNTTKRYVLCPNTVFDLGFGLPGAVGIENGQKPLTPRPNTEYSCGEDGEWRVGTTCDYLCHLSV